MRFGVLGPLEVVEGDHRHTLGGPKQRAVLALLVANASLPVATGTLIDGLYGEGAPERAHRSIHTFVSNLRSELGEVIERIGEGCAFIGDRMSIDAVRFEEAVIGPPSWTIRSLRVRCFARLSPRGVVCRMPTSMSMMGSRLRSTGSTSCG